MQPDTKSIAQIRVDVAQGQTLWDFLAALPWSQEAQMFYGLMLSGTVGMLASWLVRWARGQAGPLHIYLFTDNARATVLAFAAYLAVCFASISSGIFTTQEGVFVGWANLLWFGLTNGFGTDTVANKSTMTSDSKPINSKEIA